MKRYRYVILSSYGASWDISRDPTKTPGGFLQKPWFMDQECQDLQELLDKGWRPVREIGMGGGGDSAVAFALILLEKDRSDATPASPVARAVEEK
jgi:hypothetical protein